MEQNYSFFLFTQLVNHSLVDKHDLSITYDSLFPIVCKHFEIFTNNDNGTEISEYEAIEMYLENAKTLLAELMEWDEAKDWDCEGKTFLIVGRV